MKRIMIICCYFDICLLLLMFVAIDFAIPANIPATGGSRLQKMNHNHNHYNHNHNRHIDREDLMFRYVERSIAQISNPRHNANNFTDKAVRKKICFPDIGCFTDDGPMKQTGRLPSSLENIGTGFYAYIKNESDPSAKPTEHLLYPHDPNSFSVLLPFANESLIFIIHGFTNSYQSPLMMELRDSLFYLTAPTPAVIVVNWKLGAAAPNYPRAATNTQVVGRQTTFLVHQLLKSGIISNTSRIQILGFSLGAQAAGFAGKWSKEKYGLQYGRITGLDAAWPLFEDYEGSYLTASDAKFVDAIHTSAGRNLVLGKFGMKKPYGTVDFYPNGGSKQPHCSRLSLRCNHNSAVTFYAASIRAQDTCHFRSYMCKDWQAYAAGFCWNLISDTELGYLAGQNVVNNSRYLATTDHYPYCDIALPPVPPGR